jgi:hypothetical protein
MGDRLIRSLDIGKNSHREGAGGLRLRSAHVVSSMQGFAAGNTTPDQ